MEIHLKIIGIALIFLALIHIVFPKYFNWEKELKSLSLVNAKMMVIHTFFLVLTVFMMGLLYFTSSSELLETILGRRLCLGFAIFWSIRFLVQFFGCSSSLWKGKVFETSVHIVFSLFWGYCSVVFWFAVMVSWLILMLVLR